MKQARKPRGPGRSRVVPGANPQCREEKCQRHDTVFHRWNWWCPKHDPGTKPDPTCTHGASSPVLGVVMCSYCGGTL